MIKEIFDLKNSLSNRNIKGIALDIDETLSATLPYWFKIMQEKFGNPEKLSVLDMIKKYKYYKNVPYWQTPEAWKLKDELRYSNDLQMNLGVLKEANKHIQKISDIVPVVAYITARPEDVVSGTKAWLVKHKFPDAPIIAKPEYVEMEKANAWKIEVLNFLHPEVVGIIDDNPGFLDASNIGYKGNLFLYDSRPEDIDIKRERLYICPDWDSVIKAIQKSFLL